MHKYTKIINDGSSVEALTAPTLLRLLLCGHSLFTTSTYLVLVHDVEVGCACCAPVDVAVLVHDVDVACACAAWCSIADGGNTTDADLTLTMTEIRTFEGSEICHFGGCWEDNAHICLCNASLDLLLPAQGIALLAQGIP